MLKLKLQYFGHLMRRVDSLEKTLMLGGIGGRRKRGQQRKRWWMASLTRWTWVWVNSRRWWWTGGPACCDSWGCKESDTTEWLNWTEPNITRAGEAKSYIKHWQWHLRVCSKVQRLTVKTTNLSKHINIHTPLHGDCMLFKFCKAATGHSCNSEQHCPISFL